MLNIDATIGKERIMNDWTDYAMLALACVAVLLAVLGLI